MEAAAAGRSGGVAAGGGRSEVKRPLPDEMRSLGTPAVGRTGAQPCRFIARRATNGAPPSEAT